MKFYFKLQKNTNLTESVCDVHITSFGTNAYQNVSFIGHKAFEKRFTFYHCNNPFSCSFRKSGTALPPLVHQIHVCTSTLTSSFILFGFLGEFSEFRSVRYTCLHLKFAGCSPRLLLLWLPGSGSVNPTAEAEALLTLNIQDLLTCLPTLHPDYRFHGDGKHLLAIFIVTNSSTVLAHSRYSLGAYGNWFHFDCWSFHLPIVVWKEGGMVVGWSWWCVSEGSKGGAKGKENKITWSFL